MKTRHLIVCMALVAAGLVEVAVLPRLHLDGSAAASAGGAPRVTASATPSAPPPAYDVTHLLRPDHKYIGVAIDGAPADPALIPAFAAKVGKAPNIVEMYESFTDGFAAAQVRSTYQAGALTLISWEPFAPTMATIAAGGHDGYLKTFAQAVRALNLPVAITIGHEMNGNWYPWGPKKTHAADFVAAWRHVHDIFVAADATNVIWVWTPNVVNPLPKIKLAPLWPGDDYVDWVGIDGYYTPRGQQNFTALFHPTLVQVRAFTDKPVLIVETAVEAGAGRASQINNLFAGVRAADDFVGFVWFDKNGSGKWKIDNDAAAVAAYRAKAADDIWGFPVR